LKGDMDERRDGRRCKVRIVNNVKKLTSLFGVIAFLAPGIMLGLLIAIVSGLIITIFI